MSDVPPMNDLGPTEVPEASNRLQLPPGVRRPPWHVRLRFWWLSRRHPDGFAYYFPMPEVPEGMEDAFYDPSWDDWREPRSLTWVWVLLLVLVVGLGSIIAIGRPAPKESQAVAAKKEFKVDAKGANGPGAFVKMGIRAPDQAFTGRSGSFQRRFLTSAGVVLLSVTCDCHAIFGLEVYDADQSLVTSPLNAQGLYFGTIAYANTFQWHTFSVQADGPWKVIVRSPNSTPLVNLPQYYALGNDQVLGPFQGGQTLAVDAKVLPIAASDWSFEVLNAEGQVVQTLLQRSGRYQGAMTVGLPQGPVYLSVRSSALWSLRLTPVG